MLTKCWTENYRSKSSKKRAKISQIVLKKSLKNYLQELILTHIVVIDRDLNPAINIKNRVAGYSVLKARGNSASLV